MIKKFVTNALLSIVMDKKARAHLNKGKALKTSENTQVKSLLANDVETGPVTPPVDTPKTRPATPPMSHDETEALIRQSLDEAEREMTTRKNMPPERRALIENALSVRKSKEHILDDLTDEQREKLFVIAMKTMDPDFDPSGKK